MYAGRIQRLLKLILRLRSGRPGDSYSIPKELGVARRTFFRDLRVLEQAGIPYRFEKDGRGYRIADSFFLPPVHLTLDESLALLLVTRKLISNSTHPSLRAAVDAAVKIESMLPESVLGHCGALLDRVDVCWPPASMNVNSGTQFALIEKAMTQGRRIDLRYRSLYEGETIRTRLDPYRMLFRFPGWYVVGRSSKHREVRTFKLDRIDSAKLLDDRFKVDRTFSLAKHFGNAWRMIPEGRTCNVRLRFTPKVASNVEEVQWHATQKTTRLPDGGLDFEADVDGLGEIAWWILGYGDQVEVLDPPELRKRVVDVVKRMAHRYNGSQGRIGKE